MNNIDIGMLCKKNYRINTRMICKLSYKYNEKKTKHICEHPEACYMNFLIEHLDSRSQQRFLEYTRRK